MKDITPPTDEGVLPDTGTARLLSLFTAIGMGAVSLIGLIFPRAMFGSTEVGADFLAIHWITMLIGIPLLLGMMNLARRDHILGLLFWPGALVVIIYAGIILLFGTGLNALTPVYLAVTLVCAYLIIDLLRKLDRPAVSARSRSAPTRVCGVILLAFGTSFFLRNIFLPFGEDFSGTHPEIGALAAGLVVTAAMTASGLLLLENSYWGFITAPGLLLAVSALLAGFLIYFLIQTLFTENALTLPNLILINLLGLVIFIPFGIYIYALRPTQAENR